MPLLDLISSWKNESPSESLLTTNLKLDGKRTGIAIALELIPSSQFSRQFWYLAFTNHAKALTQVLFQCAGYYVRHAVLESCEQSITPIKFPLSLSVSFEVNLVRRTSLFTTT